MAWDDKPEGYDDAPQWQKDAWDSELNKVMRTAVQSAGWCAPSACGAGICTFDGEHEESCPGAGWAYDSGPFGELFELPTVSVRRGGIKWPRYRVETLVITRKKFLRRKRWELHIRYHEGARPMHHYMEFTDESAARNAEQIIKFMMQWINDEYHAEKRKNGATN